TAGTGEEARSSACRTARYRRSPPLPQALRADTAAGPLRADRLPCRAAADPGTLQNIPERQALRSAPLTPPPLPSRPRQIESEDHDRFSTSVVCHELLHPITLLHGARALEIAGFDLHGVEAAVAIGIEPLADGITDIGRLLVFGHTAP